MKHKIKSHGRDWDTQLRQLLGLPVDPQEIVRLESVNALRQFDAAQHIIDEALASRAPFTLRPSLIHTMHRLATFGVEPFAGSNRPWNVEISNSTHVPPTFEIVPFLIEDMCEYVNLHWALQSPIHLAAFVLWRLNWIHPFCNGNGRTSRIMAYIVLSVGLRLSLPGEKTIPELMSSGRRPYYDALRDADSAWRDKTVDVSRLESLLENLLEQQLSSFHPEIRRTGSRG